MKNERFSFLVMHGDAERGRIIRSLINELFPKNFVYEESSFLDGLNTVLQKDPHITILDLSIKDLNHSSSIEVLSSVRTTMPIIIVCTEKDKPKALNAITRGADNYIILDKNYSKREFERTISSFLGYYNPVTYIRKFYCKETSRLTLDKRMKECMKDSYYYNFVS